MTREELLEHADRLIAATANENDFPRVFPQVCEFLRTYGGKNNSFLRAIERYIEGYDATDWFKTGPSSQEVGIVLGAFRDYVQSGLHDGISPERKAQLDVVSDFLGMANDLLEAKGVHPAAAAVLIGATVEEFLRTWVEDQGLSLKGRKPSLEAYSQVLRDANLLTKQDGKDITSWAGVRNHAAHGEWDEVADKSRIRLMLEGVNLFMRKYSP